ncbi:odorant receptor 4-like [Pogonomyrmex barbatus]|uniref:Odorant receptor 4-like n=1 Tax=Pogonomyrmex barbatus TaxID=144034 RepID=A0A8N1S7G5_9HYME|nr:odorant receptor 4-like [Pogonomyrmex barbatus]
MEEYGNNTKRYTAVIIFFTICSLFIAYITPFLMPMLSIILHINKSEPYQMLYFMTEYFIDQEKYSYLILLHINIVLSIGATTVTATGTMLRGCLIHACGMFKIARYSEFLLSSFQGSFFLIILVSVISLSLNLFSVFQSASLGNNQECVLHVVILSVLLLYMFLANYVGQEVADHNNYVYTTAYNVRWYTAPLSIQKLILFLLQRGNKTFSLNVGGLFAASLKCFASLTSASISYFTVIYSTQQ